MNGQVTYIGGNNDKSAILQVLGGAGNVINGQLSP
jgi:hypothetical protein